MTEEELAEKIRPVQLLGGYEYRLAEPDYLLARRIRAMKAPPATLAHDPAGERSPDDATISTSLKPQHIFPPDGRTNVTSWNTSPTMRNGHFTTGGGCTTALIGRTTGITAAHCLYSGGWKTWTLTTDTTEPSGVDVGISYGAFNDGSPASGETPWGRWMPPSLIVPGQWAANSSDRTWDFAIIEWHPTNYPGDVHGWFGAVQWLGNPVYFHGYSGDKPLCSQWFRNGDMSHGFDAQYVHYTDIVGGDSGGVFYNGSYQITCVQDVEHTYVDISGTHHQNWCRRWDSATYNFFDAYATNWP